MTAAGDRRSNASRLVLGTAQFGMPYGATNRRGRVPEAEVSEILAIAEAAGIAMLDTAAGYGESESVLGRCLAGHPRIKVATKTPAFPGPRIGAADGGAIRAALEQSMARLGRARIDVLLLHHGADLLKPGGDALAAALAETKAAGLAARVGVSVYDRGELDGVLERMTPDVVQLPLNLFDQRFRRDGSMARLRSLGISVQARSAFLQGILLADRATLPGYFAGFEDAFARYRRALADAGLTPLQACLGFVLGAAGADSVVVGVTGADELREILAALEAVPAAFPDMSALASDDAALIDPRRWQRAQAASPPARTNRAFAPNASTKE